MPNTLKTVLVGKARDPLDPRIFHHVSLVAFLAWVGLGADGLSSSAYGPEEAYKALGSHVYLAVFLTLMTAATVFVISFAYSLLIEHFPGGGGGYLVATKLLGPRFGVVSGCALIVDYILTITVSVATGCDAIFSFLPVSAGRFKVLTSICVLIFLIVLNLRGVRESVTFLLPIFIVFVVTHFLLITYGLASHLHFLPDVVQHAGSEARRSSATLGFIPTLFILLRAYSLGGGTYTGIEAVSNGVQILREPRVHNAKKTMLYMALSLAFTAGGILFCYMLIHAQPVPGRTLNAVLADALFSHWRVGGFIVGPSLVVITLISEGALLFVAAQTGFIDGPRILANMAVDSWLPHRFAQLSDRLVTNNGIVLMGLGAIVLLMYSNGNSSLLVLMYSINVFLTFTLTELGMSRYWIQESRSPSPPENWRRNLAVHGTGLTMCLSILLISIFEKFTEGGWLTVVVTSSFIALAFAIKRHYTSVREQLRRLDEQLLDIPVRPHEHARGQIQPEEPVAVMLVSGFSGLGVHTVLSVQTLFPKQYKSYVFVSVGVIDSAVFKGQAEVEALKRHTIEDLEKYVDFAHKLGFKAEYRFEIGTEAVQTVVELCEEVRKEFPRSIFYLGQLVFENDRFYYRLLHNETAFAIQRRLQFAGLQAVVLPIRVLEPKSKSRRPPRAGVTPAAAPAS
ncbi:MAG TPA: APC family permease [Thermoanaerobaculia bacterium]|nr:APC family permease [Thermoanaerobaculia bacterium]